MHGHRKQNSLVRGLRTELKDTSTYRVRNLSGCVDLGDAYINLIRHAAEIRERHVLRLPAVVKKTGRAASTIWRDVKVGIFVPPINIGIRSVGWLQHEIDAVLEARAYASRSGVALNVEVFISSLIATRTATVPPQTSVPAANRTS
jgi:prophage regulatory protein